MLALHRIDRQKILSDRNGGIIEIPIIARFNYYSTHNLFILFSQLGYVFYNPADSGAVQLKNDNIDMTLGTCSLQSLCVYVCLHSLNV